MFHSYSYKGKISTFVTPSLSNSLSSSSTKIIRHRQTRGVSLRGRGYKEKVYPYFSVEFRTTD